MIRAFNRRQEGGSKGSMSLLLIHYRWMDEWSLIGREGGSGGYFGEGGLEYCI